MSFCDFDCRASLSVLQYERVSSLRETLRVLEQGAWYIRYKCVLYIESRICKSVSDHCDASERANEDLWLGVRRTAVQQSAVTRYVPPCVGVFAATAPKRGSEACVAEAAAAAAAGATPLPLAR